MVIEIKGMHCGSRAKKIEESLLLLKGVEKANVGLAEESAEIEFDAELISLAQIEGEISRLGYRPLLSPSNPTQGKAEAKSMVKQGLFYGLVPHLGCIGFIAASILGATVAVELFKPLLMNPWFFHLLVILSIGFATVASVLYLRKNKLLSLKGVSRKKKYLATMYGSTVGINLLLFLVLFPALANIDTGAFAAGPAGLASLPAANSPSTGQATAQDYSQLRLQVDILCSGHASLITGELKTISGVTGVKFEPPNFFDVAFDPGKTTKQEILALEVFKTYKATLISESGAPASSLSGNNAAIAGSAEDQPQGSLGCSIGTATGAASGCSAGAQGGSCGCGSGSGGCGSGGCGGTS